MAQCSGSHQKGAVEELVVELLLVGRHGCVHHDLHLAREANVNVGLRKGEKRGGGHTGGGSM